MQRCGESARQWPSCREGSVRSVLSGSGSRPVEPAGWGAHAWQPPRSSRRSALHPAEQRSQAQLWRCGLRVWPRGACHSRRAVAWWPRWPTGSGGGCCGRAAASARTAKRLGIVEGCLVRVSGLGVVPFVAGARRCSAWLARAGTTCCVARRGPAVPGPSQCLGRKITARLYVWARRHCKQQPHQSALGHMDRASRGDRDSGRSDQLGPFLESLHALFKRCHGGHSGRAKCVRGGSVSGHLCCHGGQSSKSSPAESQIARTRKPNSQSPSLSPIVF